MELKAKTKDLELNLEIDDNLPEEFWTDSHRLKQILFNLVGNSIKFTMEGSIKIIAKVVNTAKDEHILISIKDTGIGINDEH